MLSIGVEQGFPLIQGYYYYPVTPPRSVRRADHAMQKRLLEAERGIRLGGCTCYLHFFSSEPDSGDSDEGCSDARDSALRFSYT